MRDFLMNEIVCEINFASYRPVNMIATLGDYFTHLDVTDEEIET